MDHHSYLFFADSCPVARNVRIWPEMSDWVVDCDGLCGSHTVGDFGNRQCGNGMF